MGRFLMGFVHAGRGIAAGLRGQTNLKVMLALAMVAVGLGFHRRLDALEWSVIALCIGLVLALELVNTAGEKLVDILSPGHDPRFGRIKDILAGAVLTAAGCAAVAGVLVLFF